MRNFLSAIKKYSIIIMAFTAVLGVLLVAFPGEMLAYAAFFIGISLIVCGLFGIIGYFVKKDSLFALILGITSAITGIIICVAYQQIMAVIMFLIGLLLLIGGITDLLTSVYVAISRNRSWILTVLLSVASIVLGVLAISNPFDTQDKLVQLIGVGLLIFAAVELISYIQVKIISKEVKKHLDDEAAEKGSTEVDYTPITDNVDDATEVEFVEVDEN